MRRGSWILVSLNCSSRLGNKSGLDCRQDHRSLPIDFNITKSYYSETIRLEKSCTSFVISITLVMESPIQFDDQSWIQAGKIGYVWTDRMLPSKFEPGELSIP